MIQLITSLMDALKVSFSQRSNNARSLGAKDPFSDAAVAAVTIMKVYITFIIEFLAFINIYFSHFRVTSTRTRLKMRSACSVSCARLTTSAPTMPPIPATSSASWELMLPATCWSALLSLLWMPSLKPVDRDVPENPVLRSTNNAMNSENFYEKN